MATVESTPERWEYRAATNDYRCRVHHLEFDRGEVCLDCDDEPVGTPGVGVGEESEHDRELARREAEWRTTSKMLTRYASELLANTDYNAAAKLFAEATKLERLAVDNREKRAQREHDRMLIRHRREMAGLRASH